jgi:signal transduction histidine kinase
LYGGVATLSFQPMRAAGPPDSLDGVKILQARDHWWAAVRGAGAARLTYEIGLAVVATAVATLAGVAADGVPAALYPVIALSSLILVPLRLVHPLGALLAGAVIGAAAGGLNSILLFVLATSAGYRMTHLGRTVAAFAAVLLCWLAGGWFWEDLREAGLLLVLVAVFLFVGVVPAVVGRAIGRRRRLVTAMHTRNVQLHDQQAAVAQQARERERTRIARDLHDSLGHQLTLISLYAGTLGSADEQQREATVGLLRTTSAAAMGELRQILGILHQEDVGEHGTAQPLSSLDDLIGAAASAGATITLSRDGEPRPLPPLVEHAAYRVIQEGVTNALRHARGAAVRVTLRYEPDAVIAEVVNGPGRPHDGPTTGQGLLGLTERLRLAGGVLYHGRTPDDGFRIAAMLPYEGQVPSAGSPVPPPGDFAQQLYRSQQRSRIGLVALGVGLVAVVGLCGAVVVLAETAVTVAPGTFNSVQVGQNEVVVRNRLPDPEAATVGALGGDPVPDGATCIDYQASLLVQLRDDNDGDLLYRFCFAGGVLVAKQTFHQQAE